MSPEIRKKRIHKDEKTPIDTHRFDNWNSWGVLVEDTTSAITDIM